MRKRTIRIRFARATCQESERVLSTPLLIDTDMGIDDAAAVCLALANEAVDVRAIVGVGGNVDLEQAVTNIDRLLTALNPPAMPVIGRGMDQVAEGLVDRRSVLGKDGFGEVDLAASGLPVVGFREAYREAIESAGGELTVLAIGPLTNVATILRESPELARSIRRIYVMGGAVLGKGNIAGVAEFNFHRDPVAAAAVLASGLNITVSPLEVTSHVSLDESNVAHLAASGYRTGEVLARLLAFPIEHDAGPQRGKFQLHDAVAAAGVLWPSLFMRTRMRLEITTEGEHAGRSKPALGGDPNTQIDLLTAVNAGDLLENLLESLCHEAFVV
ncbi:MAG: nucleoside hydrolase [Planctomycetota bacterium]|nr:nucleoside hydrolase [Planctomycetota bacterium]